MHRSRIVSYESNRAGRIVSNLVFSKKGVTNGEPIRHFLSDGEWTRRLWLMSTTYKKDPTEFSKCFSQHISSVTSPSLILYSHHNSSRRIMKTMANDSTSTYREILPKTEHLPTDYLDADHPSAATHPPSNEPPMTPVIHPSMVRPPEYVPPLNLAPTNYSVVSHGHAPVNHGPVNHFPTNPAPASYFPTDRNQAKRFKTSGNPGVTQQVIKYIFEFSFIYALPFFRSWTVQAASADPNMNLSKSS